MTTYADLLYEAAEIFDAVAKMVRSLDHDGIVEDYPSELRSYAEKIREALRTRSIYPALSTEGVERIKKHYDPTGLMYRDIEALAQSHEQIRREKDTATSIAERRVNGWIAMLRESCWWFQGREEPMTQDQVDWFEARK